MNFFELQETVERFLVQNLKNIMCIKILPKPLTESYKFMWKKNCSNHAVIILLHKNFSRW
jgi:hypothetical protein